MPRASDYFTLVEKHGATLVANVLAHTTRLIIKFFEKLLVGNIIVNMVTGHESGMPMHPGQPQVRFARVCDHYSTLSASDVCTMSV